MRLLRPSVAASLILLSGAAALAKNVTAEIDETYPITAHGEIRLANINGPVVIETWDQPSVRLQATKEAKNEEDLKALDVQVESSAEQFSVKTGYLKKDGSWLKKFTNTGEVRYKLTVPRDAHLKKIETVNGQIDITGAKGRVTASSVNGRIRAQGLQHEVELETVNGAIEAEFASITEKQDIVLHTVNGGIELKLPSSTSAEIKASTLNGSIRNEFGLKNRRDGWIGKELEGTLGDGAARVKLETINGAIAVAKREGPPVATVTTPNVEK